VFNEPFVSYGQNHEDVVLWRALKSVRKGRYVEVGANDPVRHSISRAFYDAGWSGLLVEPEPDFASRLREARPRDVVVEAAATLSEGPVTLHRYPETGLSTLDDSVHRTHDEQGWDGEDWVVEGRRLDTILEDNDYLGHAVHFAVIDVEGAEAEVLDSVDLTRWRPWILVVESTKPLSDLSTHESWEPKLLAAGYDFCLFDGVSRFYVAAEKAAELARPLSYPACALDAYLDHETKLREEALQLALDETLMWRHAALGAWATGVSVKTLALRHSTQVAELNRQLRRAKRQAIRARKAAARARNHERERREENSRTVASKPLRRLLGLGK
jgi:FkbM family methyltransferase